MPVHRVPIDEGLEDRIAEIEKTERVVSTQTAGDGAVLVFTEQRGARRVAPQEIETR